MVVARSVTHAMAQQVDRVNAKPARDADVLQQLRDLQEELRITARQRNAFATRNGELVKENEGLRERLASLEPASASGRAAMLIDGRPVLTPAQAAQRLGISVATVSRYIDTHYWPATQQPGSNRWFIFADEPLAVKRRGAKERA